MKKRVQKLTKLIEFCTLINKAEQLAVFCFVFLQIPKINCYCLSPRVSYNKNIRNSLNGNVIGDHKKSCVKKFGRDEKLFGYMLLVFFY